MNDGFIAEISVETGTDNIISVSGNDVEAPVETSPPAETETETAGEENIVSVSGNDSNSDTGSDDGSFSEVFPEIACMFPMTIQDLWHRLVRSLRIYRN